MEIHLSPQLCSTLPNFKMGVIHYQNITVGSSPQMIKGRLQLFQESLFFTLEDKIVSDFKGINEWRAIFKQTGKDPNRYRHSAEALFRRVKKHQFLHTVNSAIDLNNFFSLQYEIPIGIYDLKALSGSVSIRLGIEGESYTGLNGRTNNLENLIVTADLKGPFGSPFVDSERTSVSEGTKNALQFIYLRPSLSKDESQQLVESLMNMFVQINGGEARAEIIEC